MSCAGEFRFVTLGIYSGAVENLSSFFLTHFCMPSISRLSEPVQVLSSWHISLLCCAALWLNSWLVLPPRHGCDKQLIALLSTGCHSPCHLPTVWEPLPQSHQTFPLWHNCRSALLILHLQDEVLPCLGKPTLGIGSYWPPLINLWDRWTWVLFPEMSFLVAGYEQQRDGIKWHLNQLLQASWEELVWELKDMGKDGAVFTRGALGRERCVSCMLLPVCTFLSLVLTIVNSQLKSPISGVQWCWESQHFLQRIIISLFLGIAWEGTAS